jgi:integrase
MQTVPESRLMSKSPFLTDIAHKMRVMRYAKRTIETYLHWIKAFILFNGKRHPKDLSNEQVERFLSHLVNQRDVSQSTQRLALNALVFLYSKILDRPLSLNLQFNNSKIPKKLPVVLSQDEVRALLAAMPQPFLLLAQLAYGSGLRLMEVVRLRVQDIDFNYGCLRIWNGKGGKHRQVTLAPVLHEALKRQIKLMAHYLEEDLANPLFAGGCRMPWRASTRMLLASWVGSMCLGRRV